MAREARDRLDRVCAERVKRHADRFHWLSTDELAAIATRPFLEYGCTEAGDCASCGALSELFDPETGAMPRRALNRSYRRKACDLGCSGYCR